MKRSLVFIIFISVLLCACSEFDEADPVVTEESAGEESEKEGSSPSVTEKVIEEEEFGNVNIDISIDEFNGYGFSYGDSVDLSFSSGYTLEDIPYYNGYYARVNKPQIVAYPGTEYVAAAFSSGMRMWDVSECEEGDTVTVTLNTPGKYLKEQETLNLVYSNERTDFPDDETFANFRVMSGGKLAKDRFYRGASPVNNQYNRAPYADSLIEKYNIGYVLDLADTEEKLKGYMEKEDFSSEYSKGLLQAGNIKPMGLTDGYRTDDFKKDLADGLRDMASHEGPYYIHCTEGKDRTGFVCLLLEALSGASYEELVDDYMITYKNYYGLTEESDSEKYDTVIEMRLEDMLITLTGLPEGSDFSDADFSDGARTYLKECGLSEKETEDLYRFLTGESSQSDGQGGSVLCVSTKDVNGNPVDTADVFAKNRITVVNLWASWCGPCAREIPELDAMNEELKKQGCAVVGFLMDGEDPYGLEDAKDILDHTGVSYLNIISPATLKDDIDLQGYPTTYFVDSDGTILGDPVLGAYPDQYRQIVDKLLSDM